MLPYTFLALLTADQLLNLLEKADDDAIRCLPLDGVLACALYYLKYTKYDTVSFCCCISIQFTYFWFEFLIKCLKIGAIIMNDLCVTDLVCAIKCRIEGS